MEDVSQLTSLPDDVNELKRLLRARDRIIAEHRRIITQHQSAITQHESTITQRESTITQHESTIGTLTRQRDEYYLEKLRLEIRLAKALKQAYGPRADRLADPGQLLLDFAGHLDALTTEAADLPAEAPDGETRQRRNTRRLRTRGRRDIAEPLRAIVWRGILAGGLHAQVSPVRA